MRYAIENLADLAAEIESLRGDLADRAVQVLNDLNAGHLEAAKSGAAVWRVDRERLWDLVQLELRLTAQQAAQP